MHIHGIGIISSAGRGLEAFRGALKLGSSNVGEDGYRRIQEKDLKDPVLVKSARRASRFDRIAILAGMDALKDAGIDTGTGCPIMRLILATGLGPHATTFRFLDDIMDFKEKDVSPTLFSHSVHNAAASYLSLLTGLRGPTLTVTRFLSAFDEALRLANCWIGQKRCEKILVGAVDELGSVMEQVLRLRTSVQPRAANMRPKSFQVPDISIGEGGVFFVLGREQSRQDYGRITSVRDAEDRVFAKGISVADLFGQQLSGGAFHCAAAAVLSGK